MLFLFRNSSQCWALGNFGYGFHEGVISICTHIDHTRTFVGPVLWFHLFQVAGPWGLKTFRLLAFVALVSLQYLIGRRFYSRDTLLGVRAKPSPPGLRGLPDNYVIKRAFGRGCGGVYVSCDGADLLSGRPVERGLDPSRPWRRPEESRRRLGPRRGIHRRSG